MARSRTRGTREPPATWERHLSEARGNGGLGYCGIDLSLRSTGLFFGSADPRSVAGRSALIETPDHLRGQRRYDEVSSRVVERLEGLGGPERTALVLFEGLAFTRGGNAHDMGGMAAVVRRELWLRGYWIAEVPPATLKVFAAGKGSAKKPVVAREVYKRWGFEDDSDDVVDAFAASRLAAAYVHREGALAHWRRAIDKVRLEPPRLVP